MDPLVDEMSEAYKNLVAAAAAVIEARVAADAGGGEVAREAAYDAATEELKERWTLFGASCDRLVGANDEAKRRAECGLFFPDAAATAMEKEGEGSAAIGDGVGGVDGPIAARENAVSDDVDVDLHDLMEIGDACIAVDEELAKAAAMETEGEGAGDGEGGGGGAAMGDGVGEDAIVEAMDGPIAAEGKGSSARENAVGDDVDLIVIPDDWLMEIPDAWLTEDEAAAAAAAELHSPAASAASASAASASAAPGSEQEEESN